jgi:hypothetical protein
MSDLTRQIIDYSARDEGAEAREAFYSALHDKVMNHIEAQKESIARNLMAQPEQEASTETE